jgi:hypothetical protein
MLASKKIHSFDRDKWIQGSQTTEDNQCHLLQHASDSMCSDILTAVNNVPGGTLQEDCYWPNNAPRTVLPYSLILQL